jgi:hypothetical protein
MKLIDIFKQAKKRWQAETPIVFKKIIKFGVGISTTVLAIQLALEASHAIIPDWWATIYPYLIGIPAGMATISKFTKQQNDDKNEEK